MIKISRVRKCITKYYSIFWLTPRLKWLYGSRHIAKHMKWHHPDHSNDGEAWKNFDKLHPRFANEPRNVRLSLVANKFNPFGNLSLFYTIWPVVLMIYNLPMWLCMKSYFMLSSLIHRPRALGKDMNVFPRWLVVELK